ncbi:MAG: UDP-N-acetylmuramoyl-L-alanine--D-glutamate ligase, partial [bacterium]
MFNGDDPYLRQHIPAEFPQAHWTSVGGKTALGPLVPTTYIEDGWVMFKGQPIVAADALKMVGDHNLQNLLMAVAAACLANIDPAAIAAGVASFPGVPHRL